MKPIIFQGSMVRAIKLVMKGMTRRLVFPQPALRMSHSWKGRWRLVFYDYQQDEKASLSYPISQETPPELIEMLCPFGGPGEVLYVRESVRICTADMDGAPLMDPPVLYLADGKPGKDDLEAYPSLKPSIHMPTWAARLYLKNKLVRVERVDQIPPEEVELEGIPADWAMAKLIFGEDLLLKEWYSVSWQNAGPVRRWRWLWNLIHAKPKPVYGGGMKARALELKGERGKVAGYVSFPFSSWDRDRRPIIRGKPHVCIPNPWVWAIRFEEGEKEKANAA